MTSLLRLLFLFLLIPAAMAADRPPNVLIIFCDDLGYADIGPFGATAWKTPNLDRMAAEGRKFSRFYVSSAVCSASSTRPLAWECGRRVCRQRADVDETSRPTP